MQEIKPPESVATMLHVIRTWRDKDTREVCIEHREIQVRVIEGHTYRPVYDNVLDDWEWAFDTTSVPVAKWRVGYSRYYHTDLATLAAKFLESRKESVQAAQAALNGAIEQLEAAHAFVDKEAING